MSKKTIALFLLLLLASIITLDVFLNFLNVKHKYIASFILLVLGMLVYPTKFKFQTKVDMMIFPVLALLLFNVFNLIFMNVYSSKINFFNYVMSAFCLLQFVFFKSEQKKLTS